jgi:hypothetical protein
MTCACVHEVLHRTDGSSAVVVSLPCENHREGEL